MKTALEWWTQLRESEVKHKPLVGLFKSDIKAIQDEAFKAGLDAAKALITIDGNPEVAIDAIKRLSDKIP